MEFELSGSALRELTRALQCLTKFGDEIDVSCSPHQVKLSSVNSSRSAFGLFVFNKSFFESYRLTKQHYHSNLAFAVTAKALLAPLKPRSANTIESCTITLYEGDPDVHDGNQSRLVVRLHCAHGVIKTHKLTYSNASALYAKANRANCTSGWSISGRTLKEVTEHFHLKTSAQSGGTDELTFYHGQLTCKLRSFGGQGAADDPLLSRPLNSELTMSTEDFDKYEVQGDPIVSISLKELRAIIVLAEAVNVPLDAAFTVGGDPFLIQLSSDYYEADFVIATTKFDSTASSTAGTSPSPEASRRASAATPQPATRTPNRERSTSTTSSNRPLPLFHPASQDQGGDQLRGGAGGDGSFGGEDEFDFGGEEFDMAALDAAEVAATQALSQQQATQRSAHPHTLVPDTSETKDSVSNITSTTGSRRTTKSAAEDVAEEEGDDDLAPAGPSYPRTQLGPTQPTGGRAGKKARWNLLPDEQS